MPFEVFRRDHGGPVPLEMGPNGYLCSEGQQIVFRTRTPELPEVSLCGEALTPRKLLRDRHEFVGEFDLQINTWAGRSIFVLSGGVAPEKLQLDISPHAKKGGSGAWDTLIQELCQISETLPWGLSPGAAAAMMTPDALACVHPAIIEHQLPIFCRLLRQLLADPPTRTLRIRTVRPLDVSQGADLQTIRWLSRRPLELAGIRGMAIEGQPPNSRALADQPSTASSIDHPITRYIAYLLGKVRRRLIATASRLRSPAGHGVPDPSAASYARQLAESVERAVVEIDGVLRAPLFRAVRPEALTDSALQSLPDHPLYSAIHRVGRRLINPGLAYSPGQDVYSALKHSYDLFELMVLYRLLAGMGPVPMLDWHLADQSTVERLPLEDRPADRSTWIWKGPDEQELELHYQALFASAQDPPDLRPLSSLSAQRVPDYVLIYRRGREIVSWIILDAKYRSSRQSIDDALGDIHRYRDSLRVSGRAAQAAYIIVPSLQGKADLYGRTAYLEAHQMGALSVYETGWMEPIWRWLRRLQQR